MAVSGAGPSLLAIVDREAEGFAAQALDRLRQAGLKGWDVRLLDCDAGGAGWILPMNRSEGRAP